MSDMPTVSRAPLHLFQGYGVELEYMIVNAKTYQVESLADQILRQVAGTWADEVECGELDWSNELVMHVIELKTHGPVKRLAGTEIAFLNHIHRINDLLAEWNACLMPTAAHPFADPDKDTRLWPHSGHEVYEALNLIFGCRGHGWMNLQSAHLNLPFYNDEEFAQLHAAVRLVLPLIPAVAAASPFLDGRDTGLLDSRLRAYTQHCAALPSATGHIIPEPVSSKAQYERDIFGTIYHDLKARNAPSILFNEWVNARGAITRFDRNTIEIRLVDMQECPLANVSVLAALEQVIQWLMCDPDKLKQGNAIPSEQLNRSLQQAIVTAEGTVYDDAAYLQCFGIKDSCVTGTELWHHLLSQVSGLSSAHRTCLNQILEQGTLATRMKRVTRRATPERLKDLCMRLCDSLSHGTLLLP